MNNRQKRGVSPLKDINLKNMAAGFVAGIFIITGPSALILEAANNGNFTIAQTVGWIFSVYVFGGLLGIILPLYYRLPIVGGHSLTGVAFLAAITAQFTFTELIGAYVVSGILMFLIGALGLFEKLMNLIPKEIISAMLAGMITKYMVNFVISITEMLVIGGLALAVFFLFSKWKTRIPPVIAAIVTGFIVLILTYPLNSGEWASGAILQQMTVPDFNIASVLSVSVPLALLILSNDAAIAVGALKQNRYRTPVNRIISLSGLLSIVTSFFGGQSANIAGMGTAICADEEAGPKEKRYMGAVAAGFLLLIFGLFSWKLVPLIQALPQEFIAIIVGFSLIGVFANCLQQSFSKPTMKLSAAFTFIIAFSNITLFHISAPVWALLIGALITRLIENNPVGKWQKEGEKSA